MWPRWMGWKMPLCKWHNLWMVPWLICCFTMILFYIKRKWLIMINLATVPPLKSKLGNFSISMLLMEVSKYQNLDKFPKASISIYMKIFKRPKQRAALRKPFEPPPDKGFLRLWNKNFIIFLTQEYTGNGFPRASRMHFLNFLKWCSANIFFWHQPETCLLENL